MPLESDDIEATACTIHFVVHPPKQQKNCIEIKI